MSDPSKDAYRQALSRGDGTPSPRDDEPKVASINPDGSIEISKGGRPVATIRPATADNIATATASEPAPMVPVVATSAEAIAKAIGIPGIKVSELNGRIFAALAGEVEGEWVSRSVPVDPANVETAKAAIEQWMEEVKWPK